jgi:hypothetical protein
MTQPNPPTSVTHPQPGISPRNGYAEAATATSRHTLLTYAVIGLVAASLIQVATIHYYSQKPPLVLYNNGDGNGFNEAVVGPIRITRGDLERYMNLIIPAIYANINGEDTALDQIRGLVNENIILTTKRELAQKGGSMKNEGVSQFAVVTGVNPETLAIDYRRKMAYIEVYGTIVLSQENKTKKTDVQWRCLCYLVDPSTKLLTNTPGGKRLGNRFGIYLQQVEEQPPGTVNKDILSPTAGNLQELKRMQQLQDPTIPSNPILPTGKQQSN